MMAFEPQHRFQTPSQLHEAVRKVQGELEGGTSARLCTVRPRSLFIVESHPKLQDAFREKFGTRGLPRPALARRRTGLCTATRSSRITR